MIEKIKKILANDLIKVFSFTGLSTLVKLITSYLSVKIIASIVGPSGIALIGQLQNFVAILTTAGAGGINNGVVKFVSEHKEEDSTLRRYLSNGLQITIFSSLFFGVLILLMSRSLSKLILLDEQYFYVFIYFGISLFFLSLNNFFLSILNGFKEFRKFVVINIITSVVGLIFSLTLVLVFQLKGALIASVTYQSVILFITVLYLRKIEWFNKDYLLGKLDKPTIKKYFNYSLMALVSAATVPVSQLLIRGDIIKNMSMDQAGYWEGMNRISGLYLLFVTTSFSVYYLPKLSEIKSETLLKKEMLSAYKIITPVILISLIAVFLLKNVVINVLFTKDFYPMKDLFFWQLIGDFFKIMSWILAFLMVAKSMTKIYIITEVVFSILLVIISYYFISINGVKGATQAYCINYFLYFMAMIFIFRKLIFKKSIN